LFLLDWYEPMDAAFRELCRDVANLRYDRVERALKKHPELACREALAVVPGPGAAGCRLLSHTIASYAAKFGDSQMMRLLHDLDAFPEGEARGLLLEAAASEGNVDTARALLELGEDIEGGASGEWWPLWYAVRWDREAMVGFLLENGADPNRRDFRGETPFYTCKSTGVARRLLAAGARTNVRNHNGMTLLKHQATRGRADLVEILNEAGGKRERKLAIGPSEEEIRWRGLEVLRRHYRDHDPAHLAEIELMHAVDYGCVLPVRSLPLPETKGN
jgi:ankyrin repeat protein